MSGELASPALAASLLEHGYAHARSGEWENRDASWAARRCSRASSVARSWCSRLMASSSQEKHPRARREPSRRTS